MQNKEQLLFTDIFLIQSILDHLPFDAWFKDPQGRYLAVNKHFEEYCGKRKKDIIGRNDFDLYPREEAEIYTSSDREVLSGNNRGYYESEYKENHYKEEFKTVVIDDDGTIVGTVGFSRDITEQKQVDLALAETNRSNAVLLSNLPGVAYRCRNDENWTMTFMSEGCYDLTGYNPEDLVENNKLSYNDLISPEYRDYLYAKWTYEVSRNLKSQDEYTIITASGTKKWVWEQSQAVFDGNGNQIASEGFITDITERKTAEEELLKSEARFRTMFETAPLGIGIFDSLTGQAYQVNPKFLEITGRRLEAILNIDWRDYSHPDEIEENIRLMADLNAGRISGFELNKRFIKPDGSLVWVNMTISPFNDEDHDQPRHLCMVSDITDKKIREDEILYLNYHDVLTGLYNRAFFDAEKARLDTARQLPLSIIMGDIDGLKLINDMFGHIEGDRLLMEIAGILSACCRSEDIVARIGGDEFCILLPNASNAVTQGIARRINIACENYQPAANKEIFSPSISLGYSTKQNSEESIEAVFKAAEEDMYKHKLLERKSMHSSIIASIKATMLEKSHETEEHAERLVSLSRLLGRSLSLSDSELNDLELLSTLHDIGKMSVGDMILLKPGELSDVEWAEMKKHPEVGFRIAQASPELISISEFILCHHEHWDGLGYPQGLSGNEIPLLSRILAIVDAYDAMTQDRPYRKGTSSEEALAEISAGAGTQFDPQIAALFISLMEEGQHAL